MTLEELTFLEVWQIYCELRSCGSTNYMLYSDELDRRIKLIDEDVRVAAQELMW